MRTSSNLSFTLRASTIERRITYGIIGVITAIMVLGVWAQFTPILERIQKVCELPLLTLCMMELARLNDMCFCLPVFGIVPALLVLDALAVRRYQHKVRGSVIIDNLFWSMVFSWLSWVVLFLAAFPSRRIS